MDTELIVAVALAVVLVTGGGIAVAVRLTRRAARATKRIGSQVRDAAALPLDGRALPPLVLEPVQAITSWVDMIRPQLVPSLAPDGTITLLFSDVEGSTELNVQLGDEHYVALLAEHDRLARRLARLHHGRLVKSQGDGLMLAFKRPKDAVREKVADEVDARFRRGRRHHLRGIPGRHRLHELEWS